ncbi:hypothetical protein Salat_2886100 [Sesamum alatum]|uniref:Uncharacterized protein n=1 Tax=Sesamum alatum TaxID=300844 RepID=A0AAE1XJ85_9LAMI|nr:hypothetical protein Salat_2886100 [Sesamum alatum]
MPSLHPPGTSCGAPRSRPKSNSSPGGRAGTPYRPVRTFSAEALDWEMSAFAAWMRWVRSELDGTYFVFFLLICWSLWGSRNQLAFEARSSAPMDIVERGLRVVWVRSNDPVVGIHWTMTALGHDIA